jgi:hypothetical protein
MRCLRCIGCTEAECVAGGVGVFACNPFTRPTNEQTKFNSAGYETSWTSGVVIALEADAWRRRRDELAAKRK